MYFTEGPDATPNYIFPMYTFAVCSTTNANQLMNMLYYPLYTYGENYKPTIDYSHSIGQAPVTSNGGKTYTIKLNPYKWSNGETVTARDLVFWMNVLKASPSTEWCGYAPGYFPDNVVSYSAPNPSTFVITFNKAYDPEWVLYSELSQIFPMPLAWDRTSLSQPAPTTDNGHLPDTTKSGAAAIYKFLDAQSKKLANWASSPLWSVVDGPMKLTSFSTDGRAVARAQPGLVGNAEGLDLPARRAPVHERGRDLQPGEVGRPERDHDRERPVAVRPAAQLARGRGLRRQQGGELLVQLLPVEPQLERNDVARRRAGAVHLPAAVLPECVPAPDRPAGLDPRLPVRHGRSDLRADSAVAA